MNVRSLNSYHKDSNPFVTSIASRSRCTPKTLTLYASMRHGWTKISATLKYCILALQHLGEIGLIEVMVEFLSQSKQPPSKLSKNLNLNRKPGCNSLRSFLPKSLILSFTGQRILFCFCYGPPNEDPSWMDVFDNFLHEVCDQFNNMVSSDDFNLPDIL